MPNPFQPHRRKALSGLFFFFLFLLRHVALCFMLCALCFVDQRPGHWLGERQLELARPQWQHLQCAVSNRVTVLTYPTWG